MDHSAITSDAPRLTAFALGELEGEDLAQVTAAVAADPALQAAVAEIRATAGRLTAALESEPQPEPARPAPTWLYHPVRPARIFRFPYWTVAGLAAAACFAVLLALRVMPLPWEAGGARVVPLTEAKKAAETATPAAAAAPQPSNQIDVQFPKKGSGQPLITATGPTDQYGYVVPNPPPASAKTREAEQKAFTDAAAALAKSTTPANTDETAIKMQPFAVQADRTSGYTASASLAGSRLNPAPAMPALGAAGNFGEALRRPAAPLAAWGGAPLPGGSTGGAQFNTETYDYLAESDFLSPAQHPLSTFSVDVDTASYSNLRRFLLAGQRPPRDGVRIEEMVNYFTFGYARPPPADPNPLAASLEVAAAPWAPTHRLVRIGLKAREVSTPGRAAANLVFLLDVSGSMNEPDKLPLVKEAMRLLVGQLKPEDRVAIVTYAGTSGLALPSTPASDRRQILDVIDRLHAGGSTNGAMGIQLAYDVAKAHLIPGGINRVILATDGDFNVGVTDRGALVRLIEEKAKTGVFLTALGVGMGNYKDATLEQLADKGNGTYAYLDSEREARRVLAEQVNGTLTTVAKDVKVQVEFNPARVQAYRLLGYEDRKLQPEDFNNDRVDAGDIGAGHAVTALYEVIPVGVAWQPPSTIDALKYQRPGAEKAGAKASDELLTVKIRYQEPDGDKSRLVAFPLVDHDEAFAAASPDFKFAAAVAGFGMVLRDSPFRGDATLGRVLHWAEEGTDSDAGGYRAEFISLVKRAEEILPAQG